MEKLIVFKNKKGKQLVGILHLPKGEKKFPLVIICHGLGADKSRRRLVRLARILRNAGIAVFRFDFEGHGDSEGDLENVTVGGQVQDLESALNHILRFKNLDKDRMAFVSESLGAVTTAVCVVKQKLKTKTLVFWAPAFNQKELILCWHAKKGIKKWEKDGYIIRKDKKFGTDYLKENKEKDYTSLLSRVQVPVLIIHGAMDETVPIRFSQEIAKKHKSVKFLIYPKAEHKFEDYYIQQKLIKDTTNWLKRYLRR